MKPKPVHEVRIGAIKAAVWRNETAKGMRHQATFSRLYHDGDQWHSTENFGRDDLLVLAKVADQRQLWSWISFDVANQSFALIIDTLLFSNFFSQVVVRNDAIDDRIWGLIWKLSAITTFPFVWVKDTVGTAEALPVLVGFLGGGLGLTLLINERRGFAAARETCDNGR